jgi:hypothetical protein
MQIWPWCKNALQAPAELATSRSASSRTMRALFPPSSSETRLSVRPAAAPTWRPTAVEGDHRHVRVLAQRRACLSVAGQHVQQAAGQARLLEQPGHQHPAGHRRVHVRLEDHGVTERQRGRHGAQGQDQREVPRADHADHAERDPAGDRFAPWLAAGQQVSPWLGGQSCGFPELSEDELDLEGRLAADRAATSRSVPLA